ncbi:hemagglutinin repeat-containing protein [Marinomonas posidonica]|uniref:two-partner secretion domain-containing protein n=1 Tax=Marinomonas posidonica TaxID=936476 RepID=UPI00373621E2
MLTLLRVIKCYVSSRVQWRKKSLNNVLRLQVKPIKRSQSTSHFSLLAPCRRHQKYIAQIMLSAYLSAPGVLLAQGATAAINSAHAPAFDTSASGIPIVNINAPSAKGVSRNEYDQLNVEKKGLIFNNATDITNTQLAGYIDGNARLGGKSASIILNEVTGNSRSALNGYMEIAGQSAEMIIANQNGITCNGCGFINTTRGTLTTGQALFDGAGGLSGFDVSQGDIAITGEGLNDSATRELDILARSVKLNAKLWADQATIITGDNRINYQDKSVTARSNDEREAFALDVAAIGGMYANRIRLIGTERGLGVNLGGEVKAVEDMTLDTQGNIVHRATLSSDEIKIQANALENSGEVLANRINIKTTKDIVSSGADAAIQATESIRLEAQALKNQEDAKLLSQNGDVTLITDSLTNQGTIAGHTLTVTTDMLNNTGENTQIFAAEQLTLTTTEDLRNDDQASIASDKALTITAQGQLDNLTGAIESVDSLNIEAQRFTNTGTVLIQTDPLSITAQHLDNQGMLAGKGITINATELSNSTANGKIYSTDQLDLNIAGDVTNTDGALVHADSSMTLDAEGNLTNTDSTIEALNQVDIKSLNLTSSGTILALNEALNIETHQVTNQGTLAGKGITIDATGLSNSTASGKIYSTDKLDLNITGDVTNADGALVHADSSMTLDADGNLTNTDSTIEALNQVGITAENVTSSGTILAQDGSLTIDTNQVTNQGALAGKGITINATELNNSTVSGKVYSTDKLDLNITGYVTNKDGALLHANTALTVDSGDDTSSGKLTNTDATIEALNTIDIKAENVTSSGTILAQNGALTIQTNKVDNQGTLAGKGITIDATELSNSTTNGQIYSTEQLDLNITGDVTNEYGALVHADFDLILDADGNLTNKDSTIEALNTININSENVSSSGTVLAQDGALTIQTNQVDNQGTLAGKGITINATELSNSTANGKIYSTDKLDLNITGDVSNRDGALLHASTALTVDSGDDTSSGKLTNTNAAIEALNTIDINAENVASSGAVLAEGGALTIQTNQLDNQGVLAGKGITINATELNNSSVNGKVYSTDKLDLNIAGNVKNTDGALVHADSDLTLDAEGNLTNTNSTIEALNQVDIKSQNLTSSGTILAQDGTLIIQTNKVYNQGNLAGKGITIDATELNNSSANAKIYSTDAIALNVQGNITNEYGVLVHADSDLILDAEGNLTNTESIIEALNQVDIKSQNLTSSGTILAQDGALTIQTNKVDNQGTLAGKGITIDATELSNSTASGKIYSTDRLDLNITGDVTNEDGALVHADSDLTLDAEGNLTNTDSTIEALNTIDINAENVASSGGVLAQEGALTIQTNKVDNQGTLAGKGITIDATELNNSTTSGKIYSKDAIALNVQGNITNDDGALIHADSDLTLDADGNLTNTSSTIEALNTIDINTANVTSSGTILAQDGTLTIQTNKVDNQGSLAGKGITIDATELNNSSANAKIYSTDAMALNVQGNITNEDGALVHADSTLTLDAEGNLTNTDSTIEAFNEIDITAETVTSSGTVLAQDGTLTIQTNKVDNQGSLAGKGITIKATELNNSTVNGKVYSTDKLDLNIAGNVTNTDSALVHADSDLTLDADGNLTNTSSTIEALNTIDINTANVTSSGTILAQDGTLTIQTNKVDNQGTLAGKGITIDATELNNSTTSGKIYSKDAIALNVQGNITNDDGALVHADTDLTLDAEGSLTNTNSTIEALNQVDIKSQNLTSSGTILAQDGSLTIDTNQVTNQGTLAGKGISINATELNNSTVNGKVYSTDKLDLNIAGNVTNTDGALVHADTALTLDTEGNLTNTESTIEALNTIDINAENVTSSGTVLAQDGALTIQTNKVDNQGVLAGKGITINATELNNSSVNGKVYSTDKLDLNIAGNVKNTDGALVHADSDLTLDAEAKLTNTDSTIEALNQVDIKSQNLTNSGTILAQDGSLTIDTNQVTNQGALAGKGITINATELNNSSVNGKVYSTDKLDLNITGDVTNKDGALVHADSDLNLDAEGNLINKDSTIEALNQIDIKSQNLTSSGMILAQDGSLTIDTNQVTNQGTLAGKGITIDATELNNSTVNGKVYSTDKLDLNIAGNVKNTDGALVHADSDLTLDAEGNLTNTNSTIEALNQVDIKSQNLTSSGTILAQDGTLTIQTNKVDNQGTLAGKGITIDATELSNSTVNGTVYSTDKLDLNITGDVSNKDGALLHANTALTVDSGDDTSSGKLTNTDSTIEALNTIDINAENVTSSGTVLAQDGTLTIQTNKVDNQGSLAGKGITIDATELNNSTTSGKIYSTDAVALNIEGAITNQNGALVHADSDLTLDTEGNLTNTDSTIEALNTIDINAENVTSSGTVLAQDGTLTIQTNQITNQGALAGKGITIDTTGLNNSTTNGKIYSTDKLDLNIKGDVTNTDGALVHAGVDVNLDAKGNLTNSGTIEAVESATVKSQNLTNSGTILAQNNALSIDTIKVDNQGVLAGNGIIINTASLDNKTMNAKVFSTAGLVLSAEETVENREGALLHASNALEITSVGNLSNEQSTIESAGSININSQNFENSANSNVLAQNGELRVQTKTLNNQGSLSGHGLEATASLILNNTSTSKILSTNDLLLTSQDSFANENGAHVKANNTLTINTDGDIVNTDSVLESVNTINLNSRNLTNTVIGTISAQNGTLSITNTETLNNKGGIAGKRVFINAADVKNLDSDALVLGQDYLDIRSTGNIINQNGAVLYSLGDGVIKVSDTLTNSSAVIEINRNLSIEANKIINKKREFSFTKNITSKKYSIFKNLDDDLYGSYFSDKKIIETIESPYIELDSPQAYIFSGNDMILEGAVDNYYSIVSAVGDLFFTADKINNVSYYGKEIKKTDVNEVVICLPSAGQSCGWNYVPRVISETNKSNTTEKVLFEVPAIFTAGGNITGKAGSVSNIGNVDYVVTSKVDTNVLKEIEGSANTSVSGQAVVNTATGTVKVKASDGVQVAVTETSANTSVSGQTVANTALGIANVKASDNVQVAVTEASTSTSISGQTVANTASGIANVKASDNVQVAVTETSTSTSVSSQTVANTASGTVNVKASDNVQVAVTETSTSTSVSSQTVVNTASGTVNVKASGVDGVQVAEKGSATTVVKSDTELSADSSTSPTIKADASATGVNAIDLAAVAARRDAIFNDLNVDSFVQSAFYTLSENPDSDYLIQTNPLFTNYKNFVSSDYMLNKMVGDDQGRTGKTASRLGDGFLEQNLVREQILSYTGFQTLPDQVDIESAYATLMDNALEEYTDLQLSVGIELTDKQVAQLKQPIVWMVSETVQTDSGPQEALVPKVYFSNTSDMTLRPDGALIAATNIDIQVDGDLVNSGAIVARSDLSLSGENISNSGNMTAGNNATLNASSDIGNSGSIQANGVLNLVAGGNITSETQNQTISTQSGIFSNTQTLVGEAASLQGGTINLVAGNDISLIGSEVSADEEILAQAGNNITLASLEVTNSSDIGGYYQSKNSTTHHLTNALSADKIQLSAGNNLISQASSISASNQLSINAANDVTLSSVENTTESSARRRNASSVTHQVNSLEASNIQLGAGNTFTSEGAQLTADDDLTLSANNIDLLAVKDTKDSYSFVGGGGNSTEKRSHNESITGTDLSAGGALTLVSQNDIFSKGSSLSSGEGMSLAAGGDVVLSTETAHNSSYKQVKKKKSGMFGSKRSTTTTTSESLTNQGTNLTSGGDLNIVTGVDILLAGSKATADGNISLQAGGDIQLLSAVDQSSQRYQKQKKGTFKVKAKDQGFINQTAVTSDLIGGGNISLDSGSNITLEGATLAANDTLSIGTDVVTQNANGQYVNDKGELAGNVIVTTQALESSEWSESSSSFRGVFKDLVKGIAVIASTATAGLIHGEIKVGESDATRTDTLTQQTTTLAASDLNLTAQQDLALIGAQVAVSDTANLTAQNVTIDAAQERTVTSTSHTDQTISGEGASFSSEKGELTLASLTETDHTERTTNTANTWAGSSLQAGNLNINANQNVAIIASDVAVQNDASIEGENVLIGGREDTYDTTNDTITKTKTLTVGVKNAYADTYLAVRALDQAKDAVKDAEKAYEEAKQKVADGKLQQSDLDGYEIALNSAKNTEKYAAITVANAAAGAAMNSGTAGFTASAGVTLQTTTTSTTNRQSAWNGSSIQVGNNASLQGEDTLTVKGSNVAVGGTLLAEADQINVLAGENTTQQSTKSNTQSASVSASVGKVDFSDLASSAGVNNNTSSSESQSTQYTHSQLTAGALVSRSDQLNIKGGTLHGEQVSIDTGDLNIASVQDSSSSNSRSDSVGMNIGSSVSSEGSNLGLSYQQSTTDSDYQSVTQQSGITSGDQGYQIQVANHTSLTGAIITSTQTAEDKGLNSLTTASLTASNLENHANFSGSSVGVDASYNTAENGGFSRSQGYGEIADNRTRTTQSGINTANLTITDAEQQAQTGQSVEQVLADVSTATTTDTVAHDSGTLQDHFDQAEVLEQVNTMRTVTQETNQTVQQIRLSLNKKADELKKQLKAETISQEQYDSEVKKLTAYGLIASSIGAGLTVPTDSVSGQLAAAASPTVAYGIGQYFKGQAAANADGELSGGQEAAHVLAHGILAAAVAAEGGNDATTAGLAAAGSEAAAPMLANWLYGSSDPDDLDAQQKQTLTNILGAASMVAASTGSGDASDVVAAGQLADNAVENNYLKSYEVRIVEDCLIGSGCTSSEEKEDMVNRAEALSKARDDELNQICQDNPLSEECRGAVNDATKYVAMSEVWDILKDDVTRSSVNTFDYVYNSDGSNKRFVEYFNTIDNRADFFGASNLYEQNLGLGAKWYGGAEFVSRAPLTGLGADGHGSWFTFGAGGILTGTEVYDWRAEAGDALMNAGFDNFKNLYNQTVSDPADWDINQLKSEQQALQPVHEKYLGDKSVFLKMSSAFTDTSIPILGAGNNIFTEEKQGVSGGIQVINYESRVNYGCKLMEYSESQGCSP